MPDVKRAATAEAGLALRSGWFQSPLHHAGFREMGDAVGSAHTFSLPSEHSRPPPNPPQTLRAHGANRTQENPTSRGLGLNEGRQASRGGR